MQLKDIPGEEDQIYEIPYGITRGAALLLSACCTTALLFLLPQQKTIIGKKYFGKRSMRWRFSNSGKLIESFVLNDVLRANSDIVFKTALQSAFQQILWVIIYQCITTFLGALVTFFINTIFEVYILPNAPDHYVGNFFVNFYSDLVLFNVIMFLSMSELRTITNAIPSKDIAVFIVWISTVSSRLAITQAKKEIRTVIPRFWFQSDFEYVRRI